MHFGAKIGRKCTFRGNSRFRISQAVTQTQILQLPSERISHLVVPCGVQFGSPIARGHQSREEKIDKKFVWGTLPHSVFSCKKLPHCSKSYKNARKCVERGHYHTVSFRRFFLLCTRARVPWSSSSTVILDDAAQVTAIGRLQNEVEHVIVLVPDEAGPGDHRQ